MMLAQVDRQVGDAAGVSAVVTQRARPECPADPFHDLARGRLDERANPQAAHDRRTAAVGRVGVDLGSRAGESTAG